MLARCLYAHFFLVCRLKCFLACCNKCLFSSLLVSFAFSAVVRHQALNQSVPIIGVFLLSTASLLGRSLARSFWPHRSIVLAALRRVDARHTLGPLNLAGPRPPRPLRSQVIPVPGRSSSRLLQSSVALARTSDHFLRLAVPALSHPSIRHMCHTFIHT